MACLLQPDTSGLYDALGHVGEGPIITLKSSTSLTTTITNATFNGVAVAVVNGQVTLPALVADTNTLTLIVAGDNPNDDRRLTEVCPGGSTRLLATSWAGNAGGQADPISGWRIHAT
jgi:hypothetical protein